jgi:hypothetical protein
VKNKAELHRFTPFVDADVVIVTGTPKQRKKLRESDAKVFLMGFDTWREEWELFLEAHPDIDMFMADEWHMGYMTNTSKRVQQLYLAMRRIKYFLCMTGTILDGRLDAAYPAIHIIEPRYYPDWGSFLYHHGAFIDAYGKPLYWQNHDKLTEIFARHSVRRTFAETYTTPEPVITVETIEMAPAHREPYMKFHNQAMLELEDSFLDGSLPGVATIRARQIMAHPETMNIGPGVETGKDERLRVHLEDALRSGISVLIYAALIPEQVRILALVQSIGLTAALINGTVTGPAREKNRIAFEAREIQVMVASPATASVGLNWEHVDHIILVSMDYKDTNFTQAIRRADRGTRTTPLRVTIFEYEDTVDGRIMQIHENKSRDAHKVDPTYKILKFK